MSAYYLDRVGPRRILIYIEKRISQLVYHKQDECKTPEEFFNLHEQCATDTLKDVQERKGIFSFKVERVDFTKTNITIVFSEGFEPTVINWELKPL